VTGALTLVALLGWAAAAALVLRARTRDELVAHASHELRGPLTAAQLALHSMTRSGDVAPDRAHALEAQLRRARMALDDLAAAPAGARAPDDREAVHVSGLMAGLALTWTPVAAAEGRELRVATWAAGLSVMADRTRLAQAAGNLIANALEHGAGPVEVRARASGEQLRIEVRDGGCGLPAPVADLIRRPRGARGHGLAIAAGIADRLGGRLIAAPSVRGAALVLELPLCADVPETLETGS
jgi:signal transduction histidine kinase